MYDNARYVTLMGETISITVEIDGKPSSVPLDPANTDYQNIMKLVEDGELTIAEPENTPIE
jgi:hypothetical protein